MANKQISQLTPKPTPVASTDQFGIDDVSSASWKITVANLQTYFTTLYVLLAGGTMTGPLTLSGDPTTALQAVTKQYADNIAAGLNPIPGVLAASTVNLNATYANGTLGVGATLINAGTQAAFVIDGYTASLNDRILIKNQTSQFQNGIYTVTTLGSGSTNWVLTRATDYDTVGEISPGDLTAVENGTQIGASYYQTATVTVMGTSAIVFSAFFQPSNYALSGANANITSMTGLTGYLAAPLGFKDASGNIVFNVGFTASAVNYLSFFNSAAGGPVTILANGSDTNIDFTLSGKGTGAINLKGTGTNNSAAPGNVGEVISSIVAGASAIAVTGGVPANVTFIDITAGDWDIFGQVVLPNAGTSNSTLQGWASGTSATLPDQSLRVGPVLGSGGLGNGVGCDIATIPVQVAATTRIYLSVYSQATATACGAIYARRRR